MPTDDTPSHAHDDALDEGDDPVEGKTLDELRAELDAIDIYDTCRADKWVGREEDLILITPADSAPKDDDTPKKRAAANAPIPLNNTRLTDAAWRRLPLRTALRHTLGGKRAIIGHQVLAVAKALYGRDAYGLRFLPGAGGPAAHPLGRVRPRAADAPARAHGRGSGADRRDAGHSVRTKGGHEVMHAPFPFPQPTLSTNLDLPRCPHCQIALPRLKPQLAHIYETKSYRSENRRFWRVYFCATCGGGVLAGNVAGEGQPVLELYPNSKQVDESVPHPAGTYLQQALESIHAPIGAVMLAASAIDAMLKTQGYEEGSLSARIKAAAKAHLITQEMAAWAHEVRLDANDQRHADSSQPLPDEAQAKKCVDFALALAEFLFVLPAKVNRGRSQ